jgi:molecular chaperone DnaJ
VRLKGKGMPSLRNKQVRGDHYVTLVVQVPDHLSSDAKDLLREFDKASGNTLNAVEQQADGKDKKKKGFWNK